MPLHYPTRAGIALTLLALAAPACAATTDFGSCGSTLRAAAVAQGVSAERFDALFADVTPDMSVLPLLDAQPEFTTPIWDYLAALVDEQRIADGRAMLATHRELLRVKGSLFQIELFRLSDDAHDRTRFDRRLRQTIIPGVAVSLPTADEIVIVRSHIPGRVATEMCSAPSKSRCS